MGTIKLTVHCLFCSGVCPSLESEAILDKRRAFKALTQNLNQNFCGARMNRGLTGKHSCRLSGRDGRGNEIDNLGGVRADCDTS